MVDLVDIDASASRDKPQSYYKRSYWAEKYLHLVDLLIKNMDLSPIQFNLTEYFAYTADTDSPLLRTP